MLKCGNSVSSVQPTITSKFLFKVYGCAGFSNIFCDPDVTTS